MHPLQALCGNGIFLREVAELGDLRGAPRRCRGKPDVFDEAGAPNFVKLKVISQPFLQDDTGSASASVNITLHFDKSGAQAYNYPITLYGELEIEEDDGGEGEGE